MGMAWPRGLSSSWLNVEALSCFGFLFLSLWLCVLVFLWPDLTKIKASGGGRARQCAALLLLSPLLLFSSFSFASSSLSQYCYYGQCFSSASALGIDECGGSSSYLSSTSSPCTFTCSNNSVYDCSVSSVSCVVPAGTVDTSSTSPSSGGSFCASNSDCEESVFMITATGSEVFATNGNACFPTAVTSSTPSNCPSGYSPADSSGCTCSNSSGDFVPANNADTNPSCNGGSSTAPTLSPVAPVTSNGVTSCPSGDSSITSGSSISCYQIVIPPSANPQASPAPSGGGGGGGGSSFHITAPTQSSNGQYVCPPGASVIGGSTPGSMECVVSGPGPISAPTASGTSGTSPTSSASSAPSYPSSFSMPGLPSVGVTSSSIGSLSSATLTSTLSCPSPVTFNVMNHSFSISFQYACSMAAIVRPVIIGVFTFASVLFVLK